MKFKILKTNASRLFIILIVIWGVFGLINPEIISVANIFSLSRNAIVSSLYALAVSLIMALGSIDISFGMMGAFAGYMTIYGALKLNLENISIVFYFLSAILFGIVLEIFNWFLVDKIKLQPFITSLGLQSLLKGLILAFISTEFIYSLPEPANRFSTFYIANATSKEGIQSVLHFGVIIVIVLYLGVAFLLEKTTLGRQIYAVGNDISAAERAGINISRVRLKTYIIAGAIIGLAGLMHDILGKFSMPVPTDVVGHELNIVAAVILGFGPVMRAKGTVLGTLIAMLILELVNSSLIMLGIPSFWQQLVSGLIILLGFITQYNIREKRDEKIDTLNNVETA